MFELGQSGRTYVGSDVLEDVLHRTFVVLHKALAYHLKLILTEVLHLVLCDALFVSLELRGQREELVEVHLEVDLNQVLNLLLESLEEDCILIPL